METPHRKACLSWDSNLGSSSCEATLLATEPPCWMCACVCAKTSRCPPPRTEVSDDMQMCESYLLLWNGHPLKCSGFPVDLPVPFSPVQRARKFSAVLGVMSANSSKTIRPAVDREQFSVTMSQHKFSHRFTLNQLQHSLWENNLDLTTTCFQQRTNHVCRIISFYLALLWLWCSHLSLLVAHSVGSLNALPTALSDC